MDAETVEPHATAANGPGSSEAGTTMPPATVSTIRTSAGSSRFIRRT